jgi:hypothetical protein
MHIILFIYILTLLIGLIIINYNLPNTIILIKKQKNMTHDNICVLHNNKCIKINS